MIQQQNTSKSIFRKVNSFRRNLVSDVALIRKLNYTGPTDNGWVEYIKNAVDGDFLFTEGVLNPVNKSLVLTITQPDVQLAQVQLNTSLVKLNKFKELLEGAVGIYNKDSSHIEKLAAEKIVVTVAPDGKSASITLSKEIYEYMGITSEDMLTVNSSAAPTANSAAHSSSITSLCPGQPQAKLQPHTQSLVKPISVITTLQPVQQPLPQSSGAPVSLAASASAQAINKKPPEKIKKKKSKHSSALPESQSIAPISNATSITLSGAAPAPLAAVPVVQQVTPVPLMRCILPRATQSGLAVKSSPLEKNEVSKIEANAILDALKMRFDTRNSRNEVRELLSDLKFDITVKYIDHHGYMLQFNVKPGCIDMSVQQHVMNIHTAMQNAAQGDPLIQRCAIVNSFQGLPPLLKIDIDFSNKLIKDYFPAKGRQIVIATQNERQLKGVEEQAIMNLFLSPQFLKEYIDLTALMRNSYHHFSKNRSINTTQLVDTYEERSATNKCGCCCFFRSQPQPSTQHQQNTGHMANGYQWLPGSEM